MESRILHSSSSSCCYSSLGTVNRYRFPSVSSLKPVSVSFTQTARIRTKVARVARVLSMSKKDDATDSLTYKDSGVDIDAGTELVKRIAKMAPGIGGFGGLFPLGIYIRKTAKFSPEC